MKLPSLVIALSIAFTAVYGCAGAGALSNDPNSELRYRQLTEKQSVSDYSYAALLRVKVKHAGRVDDFRVEIFSANSGKLSLYVRGFLGGSVFKAVTSGDSLTCYFPRGKQLFTGAINDVETGALEDAGHIVNLLLSFYRADYQLRDSSYWDTYLSSQGSSLNLVRVDTRHKLRFEARLSTDNDEFPYLNAELLRLESVDRNFLANVEIISSSFNKQIPESKFTIDLPATVVTINKDELAELLTNLSD